MEGADDKKQQKLSMNGKKTLWKGKDTGYHHFLIFPP